MFPRNHVDTPTKKQIAPVQVARATARRDELQRRLNGVGEPLTAEEGAELRGLTLSLILEATIPE